MTAPKNAASPKKRENLVEYKTSGGGNLIIMQTGATLEQMARVIKEIEKYGLRADVSQGAYRTVIGLVGDESKVSFDHLATLPGVKEARMVETPYKLISREYNRLFETEDEPFTVKVVWNRRFCFH